MCFYDVTTSPHKQTLNSNYSISVPTTHRVDMQVSLLISSFLCLLVSFYKNFKKDIRRTECVRFSASVDTTQTHSCFLSRRRSSLVKRLYQSNFSYTLYLELVKCKMLQTDM